jgi:hypothetical protein
MVLRLCRACRPLSCSSTSGILRKVDLHSPSTRCRNVRRSVDNVGARAAASATRWPLCAPELIVACDGLIHASCLFGVGYVDRGHTHFSTMDPWSPCSEGARESRCISTVRCGFDAGTVPCVVVWVCVWVGVCDPRRLQTTSVRLGPRPRSRISRIASGDP